MTGKIHTRGGRTVWTGNGRAPRHTSHRTVWSHHPPGLQRDVAAIRLGAIAGILLCLALAVPAVAEWIAAWLR